MSRRKDGNHRNCSTNQRSGDRIVGASAFTEALQNVAKGKANYQTDRESVKKRYQHQTEYNACETALEDRVNSDTEGYDETRYQTRQRRLHLPGKVGCLASETKQLQRRHCHITSVQEKNSPWSGRNLQQYFWCSIATGGCISKVSCFPRAPYEQTCSKSAGHLTP